MVSTRGCRRPCACWGRGCGCGCGRGCGCGAHLPSSSFSFSSSVSASSDSDADADADSDADSGYMSLNHSAPLIVTAASSSANAAAVESCELAPTTADADRASRLAYLLNTPDPEVTNFTPSSSPSDGAPGSAAVSLLTSHTLRSFSRSWSV